MPRVNGTIPPPNPLAFDDDPSDGILFAVAEHALPRQKFKLDPAGIARFNDAAQYADASGREEREPWEAVFSVHAAAGFRRSGLLTVRPPDNDRRRAQRSTPGDSQLKRGTWQTAWTPRLTLHIDAASGDRRAADGKIGTLDYYRRADIGVLGCFHQMRPRARKGRSIQRTMRTQLEGGVRRVGANQYRKAGFTLVRDDRR